MRAALVVLLAGCNQIYDLEPTVARDARYFDAPIDAPYSCPPLGVPPVFSQKLSQLAFDCINYTASAAKNRAIAMCRDGANKPRISTGPVDGPFSPLGGFPMSTTEVEIGLPRLAPDGELLLVHSFDFVNITSEILVYRDVAGSWVRDANLPAPMFALTTNPSGAPTRRVIVQTGSTADLGELYENGSGGWSAGPTHPLSKIGVTDIRLLWLAPDALRMLIGVNVSSSTPDFAYLAYSERASTSDAFGPHLRTELPFVLDPFIMDDCSRIYFSGLRSIFYAQQL